MSIFRLLGIMLILYLIGQIFNYADGAEVSDKIMGAIARVESNCNTKAIGDDGKSLGLFQIQIATARALGFKGTRKQLLKPEINYLYAKIYMNHLLKKYKGNIYKSLFVYNSGDLAATKYHFFKDKIYPKKVFSAIKNNRTCDLNDILVKEYKAARIGRIWK